MTPVYQTDFSPARGNALQACVASIFNEDLANVPNFIEAPDYLFALNQWLAKRELVFLKVALADGELAFETPKAVCLLAGPSPRGDFKHVIVARTAGKGFESMHDPHPDAAGLAGPPVWAGFFVQVAP